MSDFQRELIKILVDKGLLALLLLLAGALISRSLERLKSSLSWGAEVLKQKLAFARQILVDLRELSDAHLQALGTFSTMGGIPQDLIARFLDACRQVENTCSEARLVLSSHAIDTVAKARGRSMEWLTSGSSWKNKVGGLRVSEEGDVQWEGLDEEVKVAVQRDIDEVKRSIDEAVLVIQNEFPDITGTASRRSMASNPGTAPDGWRRR